MSASTSANNPYGSIQIEKLRGRENFHDWQETMQACLEIEGLWSTIEAAPPATIDTDAAKNSRVIARLKLCVENDVRAHFRSQTTAKGAWEALQKAYADSGVNQQITFLRELITNNLAEHESMDQYVNHITNTVHKLQSIGLEFPDQLVAAFMLAGLPPEYRPLVMALENSSTKLSSDYVKSKLLQGINNNNLGESSQIQAGYYASYYKSNGRRGRVFSKQRGARGGKQRHQQQQIRSSSSNTNTGIRCYNCGQRGHVANDCTIPPKKAFQADDEESEESGDEILFGGISLVALQANSADFWIVDDLIVFSNNPSWISTCYSCLENELPIKMLGEATRCFGINIKRNLHFGTLSIDQSDYIQSILERFNMSDCSPCKTPMEPGLTLVPCNDEEQMKKYPYQSALGSIMFVLQGTRPDIAQAVSMLSRFNNCYGKPHWEALKRVLRYLKGTINYSITYTKYKTSQIVGHCDATWASDNLDAKSVTGYVFTAYGGAVSWCSKKQSVTSLSSTEAEYIAMTAATKEAIWLRALAQELGLSEKILVILNCDNKGAIQLAKTGSVTERSKHIQVKHCFLKEKIEEGVIHIEFKPSNEMVADGLTKAVPQSGLEMLTKNIGLGNKV